MKKRKFSLLVSFGFAVAALVFFLFPPFQNNQPPITVEKPDKGNVPALQLSQWCMSREFEQKAYIVCRADPVRDTIRLFLNNPDGKPYFSFSNVNKKLAQNGETLAFAMNAGMYHADYSAVGLYIENGQEQHVVSTQDGPGNFHMKPNGIFYLANGKAAVLETQSYLQSGVKPDYATQSGPMLVIDNRIHQRFIPNSPFLEYRNGVGVTNEGEVLFVISSQKVNFDEFARFFRDELKTPNALFLDGSISSLYAPEMGRKDWWHPMGPIIGAVIPQPAKPVSAESTD
ncbi:MAG: Hypothetical protein BHV28_09000 [Candidatus Tokpelaia hoelldobleri]|uniref:Phosphodiester glycosidase domain-containing protein n=1 Tax=Candidatus Tokpelaia hoelldobleri TaxID=1902579 RepID=A0A1U9JUS0_9HYPH|nr:MAG: Hypothetical protein BHV28_09000 [Candidatus Tokpelaia hoelldoblerii]